jgi:hypothetical protein
MPLAIRIVLFDTHAERGAMLQRLCAAQPYTQHQFGLTWYHTLPPGTPEEAAGLVAALPERPDVVLVALAGQSEAAFIHALEKRGLITCAISAVSLAEDSQTGFALRRTVIGNGGARGFMVIPGLNEVMILVQIFALARSGRHDERQAIRGLHDENHSRGG